MGLKIVDIPNLITLNSAQEKTIKEELRQLFAKSKCQKILLINPPDGDEKIFNFKIAKSGRYTNFAPYGFGIISKHLTKRGYDVEILNLNHILLKYVNEVNSEKEFNYNKIITEAIKQKIKNFEPNLIGLTCMFSMTHKSLKNVTDIVKSFVNTPIAVGGVHISNTLSNDATCNKLLEDLKSIDLFFLFEAELAFTEFINLINNHFKNLQTLKQVFIKGKNNLIKIQERLRPEGDDLNNVPDHSQISPPNLSSVGKVGNFSFLKNKNDKITTVLNNRGCRAQCTFCSVRNFNGKKVRSRSIQSVIDELLYLRNDHGVKHIMWLDDDLLYNTSRTLELFNQMEKQDLGMTWDASNGVIAASVTDEMMDAAARSGCVGLVIGMESGNPEILRTIKKPGTVKNFLKAAEILKKFPQINSRVFLMIGFPNETFSKILDTINVSKEMNMDWNYITPLQPLPNTPIFDKMIDDNLAGTEAFGEIKYFVGGGYAKVSSDQAKKNNPLQSNFEVIFKDKNMDTIPNPDEIKIIWAFMNYYLNFEPLERITNQHKMEQNLRWMKYVSDIVAPNDPIARYYKVLMTKKSKGISDQSEVQVLKNMLDKSKDWNEQFKSLGLQVSNLV